MTHTHFFLLVVQIKFVTLFVALSLSFFLPHWKKKKKKKKKKKRKRPGPLYYTKVRAIVVVVVLRRRKEWSSSSSSSKRERRQNHRFSFGRLFERIPIQMADDAPTPTQQKPTTNGGETAPSQTPTAQQNQNPLPVVAQEPEVDRSVHPSGIVPVLQCVAFSSSTL